MTILTEQDMSQLDLLIEMEVSILDLAFSISKNRGLMFLSNSITSFVENYLKPKYGNIILSMCSEYRYFITGVLKNIKADYQNEVLGELLIPKTKRIVDEELFKILETIKQT